MVTNLSEIFERFTHWLPIFTCFKNRQSRTACDSGEIGLPVVIFVAQNAENQRRSKEENWELCAEEDML